MPKTDQEKAEVRRQAEARRQPGKDRMAHESARGAKAKGGHHRASLSGNLSRRELDDQELDEALEEFQNGTDRVSAIMGMALVENNLMSAIESALADRSNTNALFFDAGAPFGTLRARIVAAQAMGLIDTRTASDLDLMRDIRNQFAHSLLKIDFANEHIADACAKIVPWQFEQEMDESFSPSRRRFQGACWEITTLLLKKVNENLDKRVAELEAKLQFKAPLNSLATLFGGASLSDIIAANLEGGKDDGK